MRIVSGRDTFFVRSKKKTFKKAKIPTSRLQVLTNHLLYIEFEFVEGVLGPNNPGLCRPGTIRVASTEGGVTKSRFATNQKKTDHLLAFLFHNCTKMQKTYVAT